MEKIGENYTHWISHFQGITKEHLQHLSEIDKKTLLEGLTAIRNQKSCSDKALELIKNLHQSKTDDIIESIHISDHPIKKRIQNLFTKRVSPTGLQKSINKILKDELLAIEQSLKTYKDSLDENQYNHIEKVCKNLHQSLQKRGLAHSPSFSDKETLLFALFEEFAKTKETSPLHFFNFAFSTNDNSIKTQLDRIKNYNPDVTSESKLPVEFYVDKADASGKPIPLYLPLEDLKNHSGGGVFHLHESYKKLLADSSPVFEALFHGGFIESKQDQIVLGEIEQKDLVIFLKLLMQHKLSTELPIAKEDIPKLEKLSKEVTTTFSPNEVQNVYSLIDQYQFTQLSPDTNPLINNLVINSLKTATPTDAKHINQVINLYQRLNPSHVSKESEELFGRFFADALSNVKSSERNALIDIYKQIGVRNLTFGPGHKNDDLEGIDQIPSLKTLKLEGKKFTDGLFSYLKNVHLTDLSLNVCSCDLDHLIKYKKLDFKNLSVSVDKLSKNAYLNLLSQKGKGLCLKSIKVKPSKSPNLFISSPNISHIIFEEDPLKRIETDFSQVKFVNSQGVVQYEGSFYLSVAGEIRRKIGREVYDNGTEYEGEWRDNKRDGSGKLFFPNGDIFDGLWEKDKRHGEGKITFANGDVFEGTWRDRYDNATIYGTMTYINGDVYKGFWDEDLQKPVENGVMTYRNKDIYDGLWKDGKREGWGILTFANGDVYKGDWKNDTPQNGKLINKAGLTIYKGEFSENKPLLHLDAFFTEVVGKAIQHSNYSILPKQTIEYGFETTLSTLSIGERLNLINKWLANPKVLLDKIEALKQDQNIPSFTAEEIDFIFSDYLKKLAYRSEYDFKLVRSLLTLEQSRLFDKKAYIQAKYS